MSKSLGNFFTIRQVLEKHQPEVLRLFILSSHYRSPVDFSPESMAEAERGLERLYHTVEQVEELVGDLPGRGSLPKSEDTEFNDLRDKIETLSQRFQDEMDDDFNTAAALGHLFDLSRALNRFQDGLRAKPKPEEKELLAQGVYWLRECAAVLGLLQQSPEDIFREHRRLLLAALGVSEEDVEKLIADRAQARKEKNWARADEIRDQLSAMSISVEDKPDGTRWRVKPPSASGQFVNSLISRFVK
jgi:cysteinyl-tRNA synthetase